MGTGSLSGPAGISVSSSSWAPPVTSAVASRQRRSMAAERVSVVEKTHSSTAVGRSAPRGGRGDRRVVAHGPDGVLAFYGHRLQHHAHILARVAEEPL